MSGGYDRELDQLLTTTVTYTPLSSLSLSGGGTYSTANAVTVAARIEQENRLVRDSYGREVVSQARVFMKPTSTTGSTFIVQIKDHITLPSGYNPQTPPIINVYRSNDESTQGIPYLWEIVV